MNITSQDPPPPPVPTIKDRRDERLSPTAHHPAPGLRQPSTRVEPPPPRAHAPPPRVLPPALPRVQLPVEPDTQPVDTQTRSHQTPSTPKPTIPPDSTVAHHTRSRKIEEALPINHSQASQRKYPSEFIDLWCMPLPTDLAAMPVLDKETFKNMDFRQLHNHPKYKEIWNTSHCNELVRLC